MSVVQRCPNCGTTKASSGECEACHEAKVRYFCTNHTPGVWLDAPACAKCGARFGDLPRRTSAPAPAMPVRTRSPAPARASASIPASASASSSATPPPYSRTAPPTPPSAGAWGRRARLPPAGEADFEAGSPITPLWQQILRAVVRARTGLPIPLPARDRLPIARTAGGCLMRIVLVVVLGFVALLSALFLFARSM